MAARGTIVCALLLVSSFFAVSLCANDSELTQKYRFSSVMDQSGNYKLYWSFNKQQENITFAVRVRTTGWVGFGLSPDGLMPNSDVIVGWVDSNGQAHMHDRHTTCRCTPIIDSQQDWYLISGEEQGGYTTLEFTRKFNTSDDKDLVLEVESQNVIWSYNSNDPVNSVPSYHQQRGSKSLNLLGSRETVVQPGSNNSTDSDNSTDSNNSTDSDNFTDSKLTQKYRFNKVLDQSGNYKLYWNFNSQQENITFAVRVKTTGWVGFGLSPNGQMPNSDVIIGWVDSNGQAHMHDRHTTCRCTPIIDSQQDWYLINGGEKDGYTTLEFTRSFTTCDNRDLVIKAETQRVLWSYHSNDPNNGNVPRHEHKGSRSVNLLGGLENKRSVPSDTKSFFIRNNNLRVPSRDTTYWCSNHLINTVVTGVPGTEIYIYKARPIITPKNLAHVHHMMVFLCPPNTAIEEDGICYDIGETFFDCFGGQVLGAWAVGGEEFVFPEDVAFPVYVGPRSRDKPFKILLEMHYDRTPSGGIVDSSGMEFFYTQQKPRHLAGTIGMSLGTSPVTVIPPNADNFGYTTTCSSSCTNQYLPDDGITIFGSFLHSHLIGRALTVKHYRRASQCNAVEELEPIDQNLSYDFDFQQLNNLQRHVHVKKGDTIQLQCFYNSKKARRTKVTVGGESTSDEMCQALLLYYPKIDLANCGTYPDPDSAHKKFLKKYYGKKNKKYVKQALNSLKWFDRAGIQQSFDWITWTDTAIKDLQAGLNNAKKEMEFCTTDSSFQRTDQIPRRRKFSADCSYEAVDKCSSSRPRSCCSRRRG